MDNIFIKQFIIIILVIFAVASIILGAVLPWMKSQLYINTLTMLQSGRITTVEQFERDFGGVLDFYSPIGQEEVVKYLGNDIAGMMLNEARDTGKIGQVAPILTGFMEPYLFQSDVIHLIFGADTYRLLLRMTGNGEYFNKSEFYYKKAYDIGPKLPPVLYGMFDLYQLSGDKNNMEKIGKEILKYWPDDKNIAGILGNLSH